MKKPAPAPISAAELVTRSRSPPPFSPCSTNTSIRIKAYVPITPIFTVYVLAKHAQSLIRKAFDHIQ
ncbi:hypothetical protein ACVBGC_27830 [Burkholderia stagnalis]